MENTHSSKINVTIIDIDSFPDLILLKMHPRKILPNRQINPGSIIVNTMCLLNTKSMLIIFIDFSLIVQVINLIQLFSVTGLTWINVLDYIFLLDWNRILQIDYVILILQII